MSTHECPRLILMRGLPSCGKSTTARAIVAEEGGEVVEFDRYFYTHVGTDSDTYDWSPRLLPRARARTIGLVAEALERRVNPIVLDDDNHLGRTTLVCTALALKAGYTVEFCEPRSPWWKGLRRLLEEPDANRDRLERWAHKLAHLSLSTHRVSVGSFLRRMERWDPHLSVETLCRRARRLGLVESRTTITSG